MNAAVSPNARIKGSVMSTVLMHNVVSVDGYIADDNDDVGPLFEWYVNGDAELVDGGPARCARRRRTASGRAGTASGRW
jgi:hypothetical protein